MGLLVYFEAWKKRCLEHKVYVAVLCGAVMILSVLGGGVFYQSAKNALPSELYLSEYEIRSFDFHIPATAQIRPVSLEGDMNEITDEKLHESVSGPVGEGEEDEAAVSLYVDLKNAFTVKTASSEKYQMSVNLFGVIPLKQVDIHVIEETLVYPMGIPVGIYLKTKGILVIQTGSFMDINGEEVSPSRDILQAGDYILKVDGRVVLDKNEFCGLVEESAGRELELTISRKGETMSVHVIPGVDPEGKGKIGAWIKDNMQGVGTLTYVDTKGHFGALGHGISEGERKDLLEIEDGAIYEAQIAKISRGRRGVPGEITGMVDYQDDFILGDIDLNTQAGLFGTFKENGNSGEHGISMEKINLYTEGRGPMMIGFKQDIEIGDAKFLSALSGEIKAYDLKITGIHMNRDNINKGLELTITDPEVLEMSGGIIQGMSGSPIIQNGKVIGAITHVLVKDPTKGYGIFIENMLEMDR